MKIVLILMVRNESKILERCLKAVEDVVDAFCIHDTGSTDNTCEIAEEFLKTHSGCLTKSEWKDFGHNRTLSFQEAQKFVKSDKDTYGLLLDGDMVFHGGNLRKTVLTEVGYTILQEAGELVYPNCRLVRMDHPWVCRGVTHEYWDGPTTGLTKDICYIEDRNDGGCKSDKFERDVRLLEKGLAEEPTNVRYMFYLAQTYHSSGRWKDSIAMYKKRIAAGGWFEEIWYSYYMIGQCWLSLDNPQKFETYMLKAYAYRPSRAENIYKLAKYFREKGLHYKAYQYVAMGQNIPLSTDSLFVEKPVYEGLFDYEATILDYYLGRKHAGLLGSMKYMLTKKDHLDNVYRNMSFYIDPLFKDTPNHPIARDACGRDFHPTSVSSCGEYENVRFVNYSINNEGGYDMKQGNYSPSHTVRTRNVSIHRPTREVRVMDDNSVDIEKKPTHIEGLEDIRIYRDGNEKLKFISTSRNYSDKIGIVVGDYNPGTYSNCKVIESPLNAECEKNWIPINGTHDIIYSWKPLRVGRIQENRLEFHTSHETPWFFQHLRGSSVPCRMGDELWCLVHYVEYSTPRKYFHCIVKLNSSTYKPIAISLPFVFKNHGIEYCLSMELHDRKMRCMYSSWDDNPCIGEAPLDALEWIQV